MPTLSHEVRSYASLLDALDAPRNTRALGMLSAAFVATALLGVLAVNAEALGGAGWLGALGLLAGAITAIVGVNAAGIALLDRSRALGGRTRAETWKAAALATLKLLVVALAVGTALAVLVLAFAVLFWVCRLPFGGALLFAFALPAGIVVLGTAFFGSLAATLPVAMPALWAGEGIAAALARGAAAVRSRLPSLLVLLFLLLVLVACVAFVAFAVFGLGWVAAGSLAPSLTDALAALAERVGLAGAGSAESVAGGATGLARLLGGAAAAAMALVPPVLVQIKGLGLIYLAVAPEMDANAAEAQMREYLAQVDRKVRSARGWQQGGSRTAHGRAHL